ncbi:DUF6884 domain-containing protein [Rhodococcus kronopolitis]|uniref:DUF6884 domain-containing protein n=1 Tax=Rhodococcus kronopolitis TaxID=1460226 RepID=A0ABV9FR28_9NOCA
MFTNAGLTNPRTGKPYGRAHIYRMARTALFLHEVSPRAGVDATELDVAERALRAACENGVDDVAMLAQIEDRVIAVAENGEQPDGKAVQEIVKSVIDEAAGRTPAPTEPADAPAGDTAGLPGAGPAAGPSQNGPGPSPSAQEPTTTTTTAGEADIAETRPAPDPRPLVIVRCGAPKAPTAMPAGQLYTGTYSRLALQAATTLTGDDPAAIRIISARWGLLSLDRVVEPYDLRLGQPRSITAAKVRAQASKQRLLDRPNVIVLAGRAYSELVKLVWPRALTPLVGTRGIGDQQNRLARIARGEPLEDIA